MLEVIRNICPFPTINGDGQLRDGMYVKHASRCDRCTDKACRILLELPTKTLSHQHCPAGFSVVLVPTRFGTVLVNGVHVPGLNTVLDAPTKKANRSRKVTWEQAKAYWMSLDVSIEWVLRAIRNEVNESVAGLHDIKTAVGLVLRNAEAVIHEYPGRDDDEKIENSPQNLKRLLKSFRLLRARLDLATIVANPESASLGRLRLTPVYKLFHRMVLLFYNEAKSRKLTITMTGKSRWTPRLHDSFETLPLVLIDNAVKYAEPNTDIIVRVIDMQVDGRCFVSVESIGEIVQPEYRSRIFERRFRTPESKKNVASGSGLGLYIGRIVAEANGCQLKYEAKDVSPDGRRGKNLFSFRVGSITETDPENQFPKC